MNILLTNDDGYNAEGLKVLKSVLQKYGRVVVAAPTVSMSAKSVSITLDRGIHCEKKEDDVYAIDAFPADCVAFALSSLNIKFDLVVSGCNHGWNISYDTIYSGTIGACQQALTFHIPSIAFSSETDFFLLEKHGCSIMDFIFANDLLSDQYFLSVNMPMGDKAKGIKIASLYYYKEPSFYVKNGDEYFAKRCLSHNYDDDKNSDGYLVTHGYIAITPLNRTLFSKDLLNQVKNKIK